MSLLKSFKTWLRNFNNKTLEEKYVMIMEELRTPVPSSVLKNDDFVELVFEVKEDLVKQKQYEKAVKLIERIRIEQPKLYSAKFPYLEGFPIKYFLFRQDEDSLSSSLEGFRKNPAKGIELLIPTLHNLEFYLKSNLAAEISSEVYAPVKNSPELIDGAGLDFAKTMFYYLWEDAYKTLKTGKEADWEKLAQQLDDFGYKEEFRKKHFNMIKNVLLGISSGQYEQRNNVVDWEAKLNEDMPLALQTLIWLFLAYMLERKNVPFTAGNHLWFGTMEMVLNKEQERGRPFKSSSSTSKPFDLTMDEIENYIGELLWPFSEKVEQGVAILWGIPYVYDFLFSLNVIDRSVHDHVLTNVKKLKEEFMVGNSFLWEYHFVHIWDKPDAITDAEFQHESEKFISTFTDTPPGEVSKPLVEERGMDQLSFDSLWIKFNNEKNFSENEKSNVERDLASSPWKVVKEVSAPERKETFPIILVEDFEHFLGYLEQHQVKLTKTKEYISRKYLPEINELLSLKAEDATPYTEQEYYPLIHFFYHLALNARLVEKVPFKSGQQLNTTERLRLFQDLTDTEKYFFLLETFWVDINWGTLFDKRYNSYSLSLQEVFALLSEKQPGFSLTFRDDSKDEGRLMSYQTFDWNFLFLYLEWFGFWECEEDQERMEDYGRKSRYYANAITLTAFGAKLIPILLVSRNLEAWNKPLRRENGEVNPIPGSELDDMLMGILPRKVEIKILKNIAKDQSSQPFFQAFTDMFPKGELQHTLPRMIRKFTDGSFTFKVSFSQGVWRKVVLDSHQTMDDLHGIIQTAFHFNDDHLYSFFMDGIKWSNDCIASPHDSSDNPNAAEVKIGDIGLEPGQKFLYLFDYGDEWSFVVEVEDIKLNSRESFSPYVKEEKGKAPAQYYNEEWD